MEKVPKRPGRKKKLKCNLKGHRFWKKRVKIDESEDGNSANLTDYTRLTRDVYANADTEELLKPCYLRPSASRKELTEMYLHTIYLFIYLFIRGFKCYMVLYLHRYDTVPREWQ